jgi:hypothetical protein
MIRGAFTILFKACIKQTGLHVTRKANLGSPSQLLVGITWTPNPAFFKPDLKKSKL